MKWKNAAVRLNHLFGALVKTEADVEMLRLRTQSRQSVWSCSWTQLRRTWRDAALLMNSASPSLIRLRLQIDMTSFDTGVGHELLLKNEARILAFLAYTNEFVIYSLGAAAVATGDWFQAFSHFLFKAAFLFWARCWSGGRPSLKRVDNPSIKGKEKKNIPICMAFAPTEVLPEKSSSQIQLFCRLAQKQEGGGGVSFADWF